MSDSYRTQLVVLSACQKALGKEIKGEGLAGLTRGFMYAGAARVVASLWDVKAEATAELMKRFDRGMLREGLRPAEALRAAQISMWKEPRWGPPYYWARFTPGRVQMTVKPEALQRDVAVLSGRIGVALVFQE